MTTPGLLGPNGKPVSSSSYGKPPRIAPTNTGRPYVGEIGSWSGRDRQFMSLPGGGVMQFDTSKLTLADFRLMKEHYQINSSLSVLTFMLHQLDWRIECDDKKVKAHVEENLSLIWTRLVRALSQAFWAGYSPNIIEWDNDTTGRRIMISKIKDLYPEEAYVNWKYVDGVAIPPQTFKPKVPIYDGIRQVGTGVIPPQNSLWYPLLIENGDYYGRKLLKSAFQPWYFSQLMHLFSNRYYERFGEPVPVGRAPYDDTIDINGTTVQGNMAMENILGMIRNRSAVVLPADRQYDPQGTGRATYDYTVEYLESQMRGADFESYMTRLDEEMSLALFTPLLLMRTTNGGGFNQGVGHTQVYLWMLNAISGDWKEYIDKYILAPMSMYNFGVNIQLPKIKFRKLGTAQEETLRAIVSELTRAGTVKPNLDELGAAIGLELTEVKAVTAPTDAAPKLDANGNPIPEPDPTKTTDTKTPKTDKRVGRVRPKETGPRQVGKTRATTKAIVARINDQATKAFRNGSFDSGFTPSMGYRRMLIEALEDAGAVDGGGVADGFFARAVAWIEDVASTGSEAFGHDVSAFMKIVETGLDNMITDVIEELDE